MIHAVPVLNLSFVRNFVLSCLFVKKFAAKVIAYFRYTSFFLFFSLKKNRVRQLALPWLFIFKSSNYLKTISP